MSFQAHKDEILKFYESTNSIVHEHQQLYGKLVTRLNQKKSATQSLNGNLDDFMAHSFKEFNQYRTKIQSQNLDDSLVTYTYDTNKEEYLNSFSLPDKKIIVKHKFKLVRMGGVKVEHKLNNGQPWTAMGKPQKSVGSFKRNDYVAGKTILEHTGNITPLQKQCGCNNMCSCNGAHYQQYIKTLFQNSVAYKMVEEKDIEFWVDDYLNIYIPALKTYLVYNYSKTPLYSFFINLDKLGMYNHTESGAIQFNEDCPEDLAEYESIKSFLNFSNYLSSEDSRLNFKTLFPKLKKFYNYEEKQKHFAQFQTLSENLEQLAPSSHKGTSETLEPEEKSGMSDEHKLFTQSQRIRELEIQAHKNQEELELLRREREQQIETITDHQKNTESFKALLEELNGQLRTEIDGSAVEKKTIITLKTKLLDFNELTHQHRRLEDSKQKLADTMTLVEQELLEVKTLNNSLVDKQVEASQKLEEERSKKLKELDDMKELRLTINRKDQELSQASIRLETERQQHEQSKAKLEKMFASIQNSSIISDEYPKLLLKQIQDKNSQIEQLRIDKASVEKSRDSITNEFGQLKRKVSSLIN
jgi:hypothetical protein